MALQILDFQTFLFVARVGVISSFRRARYFRSRENVGLYFFKPYPLSYPAYVLGSEVESNNKVTTFKRENKNAKHSSTGIEI